MSKTNLKRITIKIGTKVLTDGQNRIDQKVVKSLADQIACLMDRKIDVIVVSSGAIGAGLGLLSLKKRDKSLSELQAIASIGQTALMDIYNDYFNKKGYVAGQILLTQDDFTDRRRFLNIKYTINTLLKYKAIPIINENDSVSTEEIKCGDNDRLSSLVADLADSDMLIILTDVEGLYDEKGRILARIEKLTGSIKDLCKGKGCEESTGGMKTKLEAIENAVHSGIRSVIARGKRENVILDIVEGEDIGTTFIAREKALSARKRWIAYGLKTKGRIVVDDGAQKAIVEKGKSLLPGGILNFSGNFYEGDLVDITGKDHRIIARGLSNYSSEEIAKIKGKRSDKIEAELGYKDYDEIVHRDNLVILADK